MEDRNLNKRSYDYNPKLSTLVMCVLFFGACFAVIAWKANSNEAGISIMKLVNLSADTASNFYWLLSGISLLFVLSAIIAGFQTVFRPMQLRLAKNLFILPKGFLIKKPVEIEFSEVTRCSEVLVKGQEFFYIYTKSKKFYINPNWMPNAQDYEEAKEFIKLATNK